MIKDLAARGKDVLFSEGLATLANRTIDRFIYSSHVYYIMRYNLANLDYSSDRLRPSINTNFCERFILDNAHNPLPHGYRMPSLLDFDKRLHYGCIALLIFYRKRLMTIGWSCPTLESSKANVLWHELAMHYADYTNGINVGGGQWTDPEFRGMGFATQGVLQRAKYSYSIGKTITYGTCDITNKPAYAMQLKAGGVPVARVKVIKTPLGIKWTPY